MASCTLELAVRHCAGPSGRCVLALCRRSRRFTTPSKRRVCFCQMQRRRGGQSLRASPTCCTTACPARRWQKSLWSKWKMSPEDAPVRPFDGVASDWDRANPRGYWIYADEDLVGTIVEVSSSCHPSTLAPVSLTKWLTRWLQERVATSRSWRIKRKNADRHAEHFADHEHPPYTPHTTKKPDQKHTRKHKETLPQPTLHRRGHAQCSTDVNPPHTKKTPHTHNSQLTAPRTCTHMHSARATLERQERDRDQCTKTLHAQRHRMRKVRSPALLPPCRLN